MSQENVELVRRVYENWELPPSLHFERPNPEIDFEMVDWPHQTKARGIEEMWQTWRSTLSAFGHFRSVPTEYVDCGRNVLVLNRIEGSGKESGAQVSADVASVLRVDGGKVVRIALYWDAARAREEADQG